MSDDEIDIVRVRTTPKRRQQLRQSPSNRTDDDNDDDDSDYQPIQRSRLRHLSGAAPSSSVAAAAAVDADIPLDVDALADDFHDQPQQTFQQYQHPPRRSTRIRNRPAPPSVHSRGGASSSSVLQVDSHEGGAGKGGGGGGGTEQSDNRLEQIDCISPKDFGLDTSHPASRLRITVHPVAMALISFHAHLSRTEVIGYLGGNITYTKVPKPKPSPPPRQQQQHNSLDTTVSSQSLTNNSSCGDGSPSKSTPNNNNNNSTNPSVSPSNPNVNDHTSAPSSTPSLDEEEFVDVFISEAFPAQGLGDRVLAKSGRNAFSEVEIDPESSVEVMSRMQTKGLQVVGWYHSHPDASFTVQPSRVDIENQANYQTFIFKDVPFLAAIIAPYNEDLPDHNPDFHFFMVHEHDVPLKIPYSIAPPHPLRRVPKNITDAYPYACPKAGFPIDDFASECLSLIATYGSFPKRVRLERAWRKDILTFDKLRWALNGIVDGDDFYCIESTSSNDTNNGMSSNTSIHDVDTGENVINDKKEQHDDISPVEATVVSASVNNNNTSPNTNHTSTAKHGGNSANPSWSTITGGAGNTGSENNTNSDAGLSNGISDSAHAQGMHLAKNKQSFLDTVKMLMDQVEQRWTESGQIDDEKRDRNRQATKKKKKRQRRG